MSKEFVIYDNVVVYKGLIDNVDECLGVIKDSEKDNDSIVMDPWEPWYDYGRKSSFNPSIDNTRHLIDLVIDGSENSMSIFDEKVKIYDSQKKAFNDIKYAMIKAIELYVKNHALKNKHIYPDYVDFENINFSYGKLGKDKLEITHSDDTLKPWDGSLQWTETRFDILKHRENTNREYAIGWHTDRFPGLDYSPGPKPIITVTLYLNDDYEGGEVAFLHENDSKVSVYKPAAGDITVFPSSIPFLHAAFPLTSDGNKYFIRYFFTWGHDGGKEWYEMSEKFGKEKWLQMEHEKVSKEQSAGTYRKYVVFDKDKEILNKQQMPDEYHKESNINGQTIYIENVNYIDGRNI